MHALLISFLIMSLSANLAFGQTEEEKKVRQTIDKLLKGMYLGDSSLARSTFMKDVTLATIATDKQARPVLLKETSIDQFIDAVGTPHQAPWSEKVWNVSIQIDGNFAQVWCDYAFYVGKRFSHCGVDAFQLFKSEGEWLIFHLADTRKKEGCNVPAHIKKEFE